MAEIPDGPWSVVLDRIDDLAGDIKEIRIQTTATNGRVTVLETQSKIDEAVRKDRAKRLQESTTEVATVREHKIVLRAAAISGLPTLVVFVIAAILALAFHVSI